jgi:hypothetical protein
MNVARSGGKTERGKSVIVLENVAAHVYLSIFRIALVKFSLS